MESRKKPKHIRMFRHSITDENDFISNHGYELIQSTQRSFLKTDTIFIGPQTKLAQTASHMLQYINQTDCNIVTVKELGFKGIRRYIMKKGNPGIFEVSNKTEEILPIILRAFSEFEIRSMEEECAKAVTKCFDMMEPGNTAMLVTCTPFMAMAFNYFSQKKEKGDLPFMDFLDLYCI